MIEQFIQILGTSNVDLDCRQIEEVLWLSQFLPETQIQRLKGSDESDKGDDGKTAVEFEKENYFNALTPKDTEQTESLFTASKTKKGILLPASRIRVPAVSALPNALEIGRALRPLSRHTKSNREFVLNEETTIERSTRLGFVSPVFQPAPERWLEVALIIENSSSMVIWRDTSAELLQILEHNGAFRNVRCYQLHTQERQCYLTVKSNEKISPLVLNDLSSRRLIIFVSDGISIHWRDGVYAKLLSQWAVVMPTVIMQTLGIPLWRHTLLGEPIVKVKSLSPDQPNKFHSIQLPEWDFEPLGKRMPIPIVSLKARLIKQWANMLTSSGNECRAVLLDPTIKLNDNEVSEISSENQLNAQKRLTRYSSLVSKEAYDLAVFLSIMPLTWPVIRLVHQAMIPTPHLDHIAEFLTGGIVKRDFSNKEIIEYKFFQGVGELLERTILYSEQDRILQSVAVLIGQKIDSSRDFISYFRDIRGEEYIATEALPFAHITVPALKRMGLTHFEKEITFPGEMVSHVTSFKAEKSHAKIFISYSHDNKAHSDLVAAFAARLQKDGLYTELDLDVEATPEQGWFRWMLDKIDEAAHVLLICTEPYYHRFHSQDKTDKFTRDNRESVLLTQEIYDQSSISHKFLPVLFTNKDELFIPEPLRDTSYYVINSEVNYKKLYEFILKQVGKQVIHSNEIGKRNKAIPLRFPPPKPLWYEDHIQFQNIIRSKIEKELKKKTAKPLREGFIEILWKKIDKPDNPAISELLNKLFEIDHTTGIIDIEALLNILLQATNVCLMRLKEKFVKISEDHVIWKTAKSILGLLTTLAVSSAAIPDSDDDKGFDVVNLESLLGVEIYTARKHNIPANFQIYTIEGSSENFRGGRQIDPGFFPEIGWKTEDVINQILLSVWKAVGNKQRNQPLNKLELKQLNETLRLHRTRLKNSLNYHFAVRKSSKHPLLIADTCKQIKNELPELTIVHIGTEPGNVDSLMMREETLVALIEEFLNLIKQYQ